MNPFRPTVRPRLARLACRSAALLLAGCGTPMMDVSVKASEPLRSEPVSLNDGNPLLVDVVLIKRGGDADAPWFANAETWFTHSDSPSQRLTPTHPGSPRAAARGPMFSHSTAEHTVYRFGISADAAAVNVDRRAITTPPADEVVAAIVFANFADGPVKLPLSAEQLARSKAVRVEVGPASVEVR